MRNMLVVSFLLFGSLTAAVAEPPPTLEFQDPEYKYSIPAPPNWELFPSEELPKELAALFYQVGPDGEPTGATLAVRVYPEQVHSDLDFVEFVGVFQLDVRSLGLDTDQVTRRELGDGYRKRISLEYSVEEEGSQVWYKQMFYRVSNDDVLMLSAKNLFELREKSVHEFNEFFDNLKVEVPDLVEPTPEPLDLPTPTNTGAP